MVLSKKDNNEPLKEALALWQEQGPCEQYQDADEKRAPTCSFGTATTSRHFDSYKGGVRVIRAVVTKPDEEPSRTWCFAIVGKRPRKLARRTALQIIRSVGISRTPVLISGSNTGISGMFFATPRTL